MTFSDLCERLLNLPNSYVVCGTFHVADLHDFVELQKDTLERIVSKGINPRHSQIAIDSKKHLTTLLEATKDQNNLKPIGYQPSRNYTIYPLKQKQ